MVLGAICYSTDIGYDLLVNILYIARCYCIPGKVLMEGCVMEGISSDNQSDLDRSEQTESAPRSRSSIRICASLHNDLRLLAAELAEERDMPIILPVYWTRQLKGCYKHHSQNGLHGQGKGVLH